jgi:hypothetical protein
MAGRTFGEGTFGSGTFGGGDPAASIRVREKPPLWLAVDAAPPGGGHHRWGHDEPDPANVPSAIRFSSSVPGGFETAEVLVPRKPGLDYSDLERLTNLRYVGAGGEVAWEGRLERAPRVSGDQMAVTPSAVGWQAHFEDNKTASAIYRDIDLSRWGPPSVARRLAVLATRRFDGEGAVAPDVVNGEPALRTTLQGGWAPGANPLSESWYDAGSANRLGAVRYGWKKSSTIREADPAWTWQVSLDDTDDASGTADTSGNLLAAGPGAGTVAATAERRWARVQLFYTNAGAGAGDDTFDVAWTPAVYGDHGLTLYGTEPDAGFLASNIMAHAISRWAPLIRFTTGAYGTLRPSSYVIQHLVFLDPTTVGEIVRQANRFHLDDWAVWENKTFWYPNVGRRWRVRSGPAKLRETGPQIDRLFTDVLVRYPDVDGTTRTVGPPGSGADVEDVALHDDDPENPATKAGIVRTATLDMPDTSVSGAAIEVGRRFLEQTKLLDGSGEAELVGTAIDDRGVERPAWQVRAGDEIAVVDASFTGYRKIVRADYNHDTRTMSVSLDAPPDAMEALLARLGVALAGTGL